MVNTLVALEPFLEENSINEFLASSHIYTSEKQKQALKLLISSFLQELSRRGFIFENKVGSQQLFNIQKDTSFNSVTYEGFMVPLQNCISSASEILFCFGVSLDADPWGGARFSFIAGVYDSIDPVSSLSNPKGDLSFSCSEVYINNMQSSDLLNEKKFSEFLNERRFFDFFEILDYEFEF